MNKLTTTLTFATGICLLAISFSSQAVQYRCKDENGKTHYGQALPFACENIAYEILSNQGIVIERVAPQKADDVIAAEKEAARQLQKEKDDVEHQQTLDSRFLLMYPTKEDITRSQILKTEGLQRTLEVTKTALVSQKKQLKDLKRRAAEQERTGRPVSKSLRASIQNLQGQIVRQEQFIVTKTKELHSLDAKFEKLLKRYKDVRTRR